MRRETAIEILRNHAGELKDRGVKDLSVFGSTARDEAGDASDVDILIDVVPERRFSLVDLAALRLYLSDLLGVDADVTIRRNIKPFLRESILEDEVRVF